MYGIKRTLYFHKRIIMEIMPKSRKFFVKSYKKKKTAVLIVQNAN